MTETWHGSCYACTCTRSSHQHQFARGASLLPASAKAARRSSSLDPRRAAPSFVIHDQHQTWTHTELGLARFGVCAPALGVAKTGRLRGGLGFHRRCSTLCLYDLLTTGRSLCGSGRLFPIGNSRTQLGWQAFADVLPSHFQTSTPIASTHSDGAIGDVTQPLGEVRNV